MIAICPAGPPKLMNPSFSQKRSAWLSVGPVRTTSELTAAACPTACAAEEQLAVVRGISDEI
jgi:hypothetical protein